MSNSPDEELEKFRRQWKEEVTARSKGAPSSQNDRPIKAPGSVKGNAGTAESSSARRPPQYSRTEEIKAAKGEYEAPEGDWTQVYQDLEDKDEAGKLGTEGEGRHPSIAAAKKPSSALDHYERAVEREEQGNLGDSVSLYRKAYKLDAGVDKIYRNKHFPPSFTKSEPTNPNPSNAPVTIPNPAHHSLDGPPPSTPTTSQLIASFAGLAITPIPPETDHSPQPPCPISTVPSELLIDILYRLAIADIASFARLSLVCKHLAHLVATEDRIWQRICLGPEYGFAAMHYDWACSISGAALPLPTADFAEPLSDLSTLTLQPTVSTLPTFPLNTTYPTYKSMFRSRPRLRFNGCYISTVNYIRPGSSTPSQVSWNNPVHIVTYYRYLRFFRDGTCVSLLTTAEPFDVVHHLSKANLSAEGTPTTTSFLPPMSIMQHALRGRWKLSPPSNPHSDPSTTALKTSAEPEGTLTVETLGIDPGKYTYVMSLSLKSAGRATAARNTKLVWRGFWSYNKLTDDWAEFGLRNDKAFIWSRVRSYGGGGE